ncbi:MAG: hypothetical protein JEZ00_16730 [Anaerolineaceae bacterium]|nr:hypothetical protein [Anaerolineaceae bacterium]
MSLYENVLAEMKPYLGKRAEAFLERQCKSHLKISSQELTADQITELARWVKISASLILSEEDAEVLYQKIISLK